MAFEQLHGKCVQMNTALDSDVSNLDTLIQLQLECHFFENFNLDDAPPEFNVLT